MRSSVWIVLSYLVKIMQAIQKIHQDNRLQRQQGFRKFKMVLKLQVFFRKLKAKNLHPVENIRSDTGIPTLLKVGFAEKSVQS